MKEFKGQKKFTDLIENDFTTVYVTIQSAASFQDGWKALTGMPQKGNHNPNYQDCLAYIEAVMARDLHTRATCPPLPVEKRVPDRRKDYDIGVYWFLMREFCSVHKYFVACGIKKPKPIVDQMYADGTIKPFGNDYLKLRSITCNLSSDTLVEKVEQ
jgi:hypothetical protein